MVNFDSMAVGYDTDRRMDRSAAIAHEIRKKVTNGKGLAAMEFGCGTGLVGMNLTDVFESVTFLDSSPAMIAQVGQKLVALSNPSLCAVCADILTDASFDAKFNYIFSALVLHHIPDTGAIFRRLRNALYDGGHLLVADLDVDDGSFHANHPGFDGHNGFEQTALASLARTAGFASVNIETFYNDIKAVEGVSKPYSLFMLDAVK